MVSQRNYESLKKRYEKLEQKLVEMEKEIKDLMDALKVINNKANAIQKYHVKLMEKLMDKRRN